LSQIPASSPNRESSTPAARWIELAERILACGRLLRDDLTQQAGQWQLNEPEFSVLWVCLHAPPQGISQNELAAELAVSASRVSGLVERLRRRGLLESRRGKSDRRRQLWRLTPTGRATLRSLMADLLPWADQLEDQVGAVSRKAAGQLLDELAKTLRAQTPNRRPAGPQLKKFDPATVVDDSIRRGSHREGAA